MPRTIYYLTTERTLTPGDTYQKNGVVPVVVLGSNGYNIFTPGWNWKPSISAVTSRIKGPFHVALWAQDSVLRRTLAPWDDELSWQRILGNLGALAGLLPDGAGVVFDGEIYSATESGSGGLMNPTAWPAGDKAARRGEQVREAVGDRPLGQYVYTWDAKRHGGWVQFWAGAYWPGDLLLDESGYLSKATRATAFAGARGGVRNLPGKAIRGGRFEGRVPKSDFWVYPWDGDKAGLLAAVSGKWKR